MDKTSKISLSIILPVYNVEKYLEKCLDSMLLQKFQDFELIIVNDGTKDSSEQIIYKYLQNPEYAKKIVYLKKENGGLSDARNYGYMHAKGSYIAFFDSDDYINSEMYYNLMKKTEKYPYDIVATNLYMQYPDKDIKVTSNVKGDFETIDIDTRKRLFKELYIAVHNKIYKKELLDKVFKVPFVKGMYYEDIVFTYKLVCNIESIACIDNYSYYYVQRPRLYF